MLAVLYDESLSVTLGLQVLPFVFSFLFATFPLGVNLSPPPPAPGLPLLHWGAALGVTQG